MIALVDVGGTKLAAGGARDGRLVHTARAPTRAEDPIAQLAALIDEVRGVDALDAIGMSVPGPFDRERGSLLQPPGLPGTWFGLALADLLGDRYGCPVAVENDANCAALAEAREGGGAGARTVVYYTVSTGVGTGIVRDGRLLTGRQDSEGGHQVLWPEWAGGIPCHCGGFGCLEALASGLSIQRRFGVRAELLEDAAAWDDVGRWLGLAVVNTTALLDPDVVLFGGGVVASWERFAPSLLATVRSHLFLQPPPRIERGRLGEERSLLGALIVAEAARR